MGNVPEHRASIPRASVWQFQSPFAFSKIRGQLLVQAHELPDFSADDADLGSQQVANVRACVVLALEDEQFANFRKREPELLRTPDE